MSKKVGNSVVRHHITKAFKRDFPFKQLQNKDWVKHHPGSEGAARQSDYKHLEGAYLHLCGLHHILKESK